MALNIPKQIRIKKADSPFIYVSNISNDKNTATIIGDNGEKYTTTFSSCTCQDFKNRHLPCKHMYKLAFYNNFAESGTLSPKTFLYQNLSKYFDEEKIQT